MHIVQLCSGVFSFHLNLLQQPLSLCLAVQSGDLDEVKRVLSRVDGENVHVVDQRNEQSHAPLHIACAAGNM